MKIVVLIVGVIIFAVSACKKPVTEPNSGIYRGSFFEIFENGDTAGQGVANLAIAKGDGNFNLSGDTATGAPLSCSGSYVINNSTQMTFNNIVNVDFGYHPYNLLDTTWNYTFDDHNFHLDLAFDTVRFEYRLVRN